jgi:hypothetical protein
MFADPASRRLLAFCLPSLATEYGAAFLWNVGVRHPLATLRGIWRYTSHGGIDQESGGQAPADPWSGGPGTVVGVGFCLKPLAPPCPSGRANHDCRLLDRHGTPSSERACPPCGECLIRTLAARALAASSAFYIMTSAREVLADVLLPALVYRRFSDALLTLCRFSYEPMRLALAIAGVRARFVPFESGDCRDYASWRRADLGDKPEQTCVAHGELPGLLAVLGEGVLPSRIVRSGNLYEAAPMADGQGHDRTVPCGTRVVASQS